MLRIVFCFLTILLRADDEIFIVVKVYIGGELSLYGRIDTSITVEIYYKMLRNTLLKYGNLKNNLLSNKKLYNSKTKRTKHSSIRISDNKWTKDNQQKADIFVDLII